MTNSGKFAQSFVVGKKGEGREVLDKIKGIEIEKKAARVKVPPVDKWFVRYHWYRDGRHFIVIFSKRDQRVIYSARVKDPMKEIKYTNKMYGLRKLVHMEKELIL
ncbi:hypothetical protein LCGC14_0245580 [marine sediment metagenome]|uniref:Uncharacterized protein n=1 Tax=marine sediment metagenome TaxID=412755 RepID=A0A0F9UMC5_9ZZZZ